MSPDGVSVVVATYEEEAHLPRLIPNLRARVAELPDTVPTEVLVADGGSTDRTRQIAESASVIDRVVVNADEGGVLDGRESGIEAAEFDLQVHADADTVYDPGWLPSLLAPFSADDSTVLSYGSVRGSGVEVGGRRLYASLLRHTAGHYAPGQNRALYRPAYRESPYRDVPQDIALVTSLEEEVHFAQRMEAQGRVVYAPSATCKTSGRNAASVIGLAKKPGGVDWSTNPQAIAEEVRS